MPNPWVLQCVSVYIWKIKTVAKSHNQWWVRMFEFIAISLHNLCIENVGYDKSSFYMFALADWSNQIFLKSLTFKCAAPVICAFFFPHLIERHNYHRRFYGHSYPFPSLGTAPVAGGHKNTTGTHTRLTYETCNVHKIVYIYLNRDYDIVLNNVYMLYRLIKCTIKV